MANKDYINSRLGGFNTYCSGCKKVLPSSEFRVLQWPVCTQHKKEDELGNVILVPKSKNKERCSVCGNGGRGNLISICKECEAGMYYKQTGHRLVTPEEAKVEAQKLVPQEVWIEKARRMSPSQLCTAMMNNDMPNLNYTMLLKQSSTPALPAPSVEPSQWYDDSPLPPLSPEEYAKIEAQSELPPADSSEALPCSSIEPSHSSEATPATPSITRRKF